MDERREVYAAGGTLYGLCIVRSYAVADDDAASLVPVDRVARAFRLPAEHWHHPDLQHVPVQDVFLQQGVEVLRSAPAEDGEGGYIEGAHLDNPAVPLPPAEVRAIAGLAYVAGSNSAAAPVLGEEGVQWG